MKKIYVLLFLIIFILFLPTYAFAQTSEERQEESSVSEQEESSTVTSQIYEVSPSFEPEKEEQNNALGIAMWSIVIIAIVMIIGFMLFNIRKYKIEEKKAQKKKFRKPKIIIRHGDFE